MSMQVGSVGAEDFQLPWQRLTAGSGLMLHAPVWDIRPHLAVLYSELAALEAAPQMMAQSGSYANETGASVTLVSRARDGALGTPSPALDLMPTLKALLAELGLPVVGCYFSVLPPGGTLPWHFEDQAPYSAETRMVVPIHAPAGARTLLSHEVTAYPAGLGWVGDVNFPHQVENPTSERRVIMLVDVVAGPDLHRRIPPDLIDQVARRRSLAQDCRNQLLEWRACRD